MGCGFPIRRGAEFLRRASSLRNGPGYGIWRYAIWQFSIWLLVAGNDLRADVQFALDNGMVVQGRVIGELPSIAAPGLAPGEIESSVRPIAAFEDGLRRTFLAKRHIAQMPEDGGSREIIKIEQNVSRRGSRIVGVRDVLHATPFDEFGRRIVELANPRGSEFIVQGITEITPVYTRLEGLVGKNPVIWDSRIATSSIPRETLLAILQRLHKPNSPDGNLATVRLLLSSRRYREAELELQKTFDKFPAVQADLQGIRRQLQNQAAEQLIQEIQLRRNAGRIQQARQLLQQFPTGPEVAGEILVQIRELQEQDQREQDQIKLVIKQLREQATTIEDVEVKPILDTFIREVERDLNPNSLPRLADYLNLARDPNMAPAQKLSLALAGWLLGAGGDTSSLTRVASLWEARDLCVKYLNSRGPQDQSSRQTWLERLMQLEGTTPQNIAKLLDTMNPPGVVPESHAEVPGLYQISVDDPLGPFQYHVQLPPEYDPQRRYPTLVTLHRSGTHPLQQIQWWCGPYDETLQERKGQATRHGYIVIAPEWTHAEQTRYEYSAREHAAVIASLRDAFRRFAIDTDRVFLSGHSSGGDAAWDIGVSHPDLWAGVIPMVATAEYDSPDAPKYVPTYLNNAKQLALYFVCGELDGDLTIRNARVWDRYMKSGYNVMVTEYIGRGHEMFSDEIQRLFDWMNVNRRDFFPSEFAVTALRPWDNFFWGVELDNYAPKSMVYPLEWDQARIQSKASTSVTFHTNTAVTVKSAAQHVTLYLSPELVDFQQNIHVTIDGQTSHEKIQPSVDVILEDARTRADRQHPFWAKVSK